MTDHHWYFAYGSNVLLQQMHERTGDVYHAVRCELRGYRLAFNKDSVRWGVAANIVVDDDHSVWGVAYQMDAASLLTMDGFEPGYRRTAVTVHTHHTNARTSLTAVAYISDNIREDLAPPVEYLEKILRGARQHGLPAHYVEHVRLSAGL